MNGPIDPRPGWIRQRTYELQGTGLSYDAAGDQAEADERDRQQCHRCDCDGLLSERAARALVDFNNRKILCRRRFGDSRGDGSGWGVRAQPPLLARSLVGDLEGGDVVLAHGVRAVGVVG
jgi:hypothetical protein